MKTNDYVVLERAVESGARLGYKRAFKYNENPTEDAIVDAITDAIMLTVSEVFIFSSGDNDE